MSIVNLNKKELTDIQNLHSISEQIKLDLGINRIEQDLIRERELELIQKHKQVVINLQQQLTGLYKKYGSGQLDLQAGTLILDSTSEK